MNKEGGLTFILGAGASYDCGAPLMRTFFNKATELHRKGRFRYAEGDYNTVEKARHHLRSAKIKARLDVDNLEEVFVALETVELIGGIPEINCTAARDAQTSLRRLIAATLEESVEFPWDGSAFCHHEYYQEFASHINRVRIDLPTYPITIITFNYDMVCDLALLLGDIPFNYCVPGEPHPRPRSIPLCKLHGSLHWARSKDHFQIHAPSVRTLIDRACDSIDQPVSKVRLRFSDIWRDHDQVDMAHTPLIVPPSDAKREYHRLIQPIWQRAAEALRESKVIIIIGYSLPATDQFFKNFFSVATIGSGQIQRFAVIDPNAEVANRFQSLLSEDTRSKFEHHPATFASCMPLVRDILHRHLGLWKDC